MLAPDQSRRLFLRGKFASQPALVMRPPWAGDEETFLDRCSRCDACITACPEAILIRNDGGYPEVQFNRGECTFCGKCVESCKDDALRFPVTSAGAQDSLTDIPDTRDAWNPDVHFGSNCLSLNAIICRACGDACESQAIHFQLKPGGVAEPGVSAENCTGCGACVRPCPVQAVSLTPSHPLPAGKPRESSSL